MQVQNINTHVNLKTHIKNWHDTQPKALVFIFFQNKNNLKKKTKQIKNKKKTKTKKKKKHPNIQPMLCRLKTHKTHQKKK